MRLFGTDVIYKSNKEEVDNNEWKRRMDEGFKALSNLETKFLADEEITDEDFKVADEAIDKCADAISSELQLITVKLAESVEGAPGMIVEIMIRKFIGEIYPLIAVLENSKATVKLLKKKYNKWEENKEDEEDDEENEE